MGFQAKIYVFSPLFMQRADATIVLKKSPQNKKKMPWKEANNYSIGWVAFSTANPPKTSPNLNFCSIEKQYKIYKAIGLIDLTSCSYTSLKWGLLYLWQFAHFLPLSFFRIRWTQFKVHTDDPIPFIFPDNFSV